MITNYMKVVYAERVRPREILPLGTSEPERENAPAISNYIRRQETFEFDDRRPESIREAYEKTVRLVNEQGGKPSVYRRPFVAGPWDDFPTVGQGLGETN
jgi:hypothetical protein